MRVFVLTTGRSGSSTFAKACSHIENYSVGHESRMRSGSQQRLNYPERHIEVDNRLSWLLGRLNDQFGDDPFFVHLVRERTAVAESYYQRRLGRNSIIRAYVFGILYQEKVTLADCLDYYDTVNSNIEFFLNDKSKKMLFHLDQAEEDFQTFWEKIGAQGNLQAALMEWKVPYNKTGSEGAEKNELFHAYEKIKRLARQLPDFLKNV